MIGCLGPLYPGDGDACGSCSACDAYADAGTLADYLRAQGRDDLADQDALAEWLLDGTLPDVLDHNRADIEAARDRCWPTWSVRDDMAAATQPR